MGVQTVNTDVVEGKSMSTEDDPSSYGSGNIACSASGPLVVCLKPATFVHHSTGPCVAVACNSPALQTDQAAAP